MSCSFLPLLPLLLLSLFSVPSLCLSSNGFHTRKEVSSRMVASESETLFKIMEAMSSDQNWRVSHPDPCQQQGSSWPGLECKTGQDGFLHVTRLDFGTSPNPICKETATFPELIFDLPFLQSVFFFNCFTHAKTALSFPHTPVLNSSLQQLSLRSNPALIGPIPSRISSLKSLEILALSQNRLTGMIPAEIFGLRSLVHLDLSYNMLTGFIPFQLGNLGNLVGLDLSYNSLTGLIPSSVGQLSSLQKLDLSSNSLMGTIPETIEKLSSLVFLALSGNHLRGHLPEGLAKLQALQYLIMDDNPMHVPLPNSLGKLAKLQELRLANSGYWGNIPSSISQLMNLSTLSLQNNRLTGEIPAGFGTLPHIYHLNVSGNLLSGVIPFNDAFLKRLGRNLDLSGNPGLCLSPSEALSIKAGIDVCENGSVLKPLKHSEAPPLFSQESPFPVLGFFCVLGLHWTLAL